MRRKLFHLQALRGLAASLVVFAHTIQGDAVHKFWITGYFGVCTFFIISGFIMYKTAGDEFGSWRRSRSFAIKRLLRIFPIYWIATLLFIVFSPHRALYSAADMIDSLLLIPHYIAYTDGMNPLLGQGWTLHYELLFYVIFATGMLLPRRYGLSFITATICGLVVLGGIIRPDETDHGPLTLMQYWSRAVILLFPVGVGVAMAQTRFVQRFQVPAPFAWMCGTLVVWFLYSLTSPLSEDDHYHFPHLLVIWGLCLALVLIAVFGQARPGRFEAIAEAFGDASYSVYLFHPFVLSVLIRIGLRDFSPISYTIVSVVGANIAGVVLFRVVEQPLLRRGRSMLRGMME